MTLVHGAGAGPNVEALVLGGPLILLGIVLFFQKSAKPAVPVILVVVGVALALGGFTFLARDDHPARGGVSVADREEDFTGMVEALCLSQQSADEGDGDQAKQLFENGAHAELHDLAALVQEEDRAAAGDLLVAKQQVEADVEDVSDPRQLATDLGELVDASVDALAAVGIESSGCAT